MAGNYLVLSRHGTTFHFRRRVPHDLRLIIGKPHLVKSLSTGLRRDAIILARALAARTDDLFQHLRTMPHDHEPIRIDFALHWTPDDDGRKRAFATEIMPGEAIDAAVAVATLQAHFDGTPPPVQSAPSVKSKAGKTIMQTWEAYKAEKIAAKSWKDGEDTAKYDHWPHLRELITIVSDKPVGEVTADDINNFQNHVLTDSDGGTARNRDKRLTRAGAVLRWAKKKRLIADDFAELFRYPGDIPKNSYVKFDGTDLAALFQSDDYRQHGFKAPSEYWLPVLALHTGARLNELCQLTKTDIGAHDGIETIAILDDDIGKRLKTTASRRIVPIHSTLIRLGFLDYVSSVTAGRLFPELPDNTARPGDFGKEASRKFTDYRRKCGVGEKSERSNKTFHSFRSTLISALRKAEVPKDRRTRLAGHEYDDTQDRNYDGGDALTMFDFGTLKADIEKAKFDIELTPFRKPSRR